MDGEGEGRDRWFLFKLTRSEHSVAPLKVKNEERDCVQSLRETREPSWDGYRNLSVRRLMINRRDVDPLRVGLFDREDGGLRSWGMHRCSSYQLLRRIVRGISKSFISLVIRAEFNDDSMRGSLCSTLIPRSEWEQFVRYLLRST